MNSSIKTTNSSNDTLKSTFSTKDYVFQAINLAFSLYILVALMVYQIKTERKKSRTKENIFLNVLCFVNVLCAFVCVVKDLPILYMENKTGLFCSLMVNIAGGGPYFLGLSTAFGTLWYRQRKLYSDPVLKLYMSKGFAVVNYLLLVCFLSLVVAVTTVFLYESDWVHENNTCVQIFQGKMNMVAMLVSYCILTVFCQVALFMFIAHPITNFMMHKKKREKVAADLRKMLKRLLICTLGCCISSLQINVFLLLVTKKHVYLYWPNFAGLDLIITAVCVIGTFSNWKQRIFPFRKTVEKRANISETGLTEIKGSKIYRASTTIR